MKHTEKTALVTKFSSIRGIRFLILMDAHNIFKSSSWIFMNVFIIHWLQPRFNSFLPLFIPLPSGFIWRQRFCVRKKKIQGRKHVLFVCWKADSVCMTLTHSMSTSTSIKPWNPFLPPQGLSGSFVRLPLQLYDARALGQVRSDNLAPQPHECFIRVQLLAYLNIASTYLKRKLMHI